MGESVTPFGRGFGTAGEWLELDRRHVWHPYTQAKTADPPLPVVAGEGAWLVLADGRRRQRSVELVGFTKPVGEDFVEWLAKGVAPRVR